MHFILLISFYILINQTQACDVALDLTPVPGSGCGSFYRCDGVRLFEMNCQEGLVFDANLRLCNWPSAVVCNAGGVRRTTTSTTTVRTTTTTRATTTTRTTTTTARPTTQRTKSTTTTETTTTTTEEISECPFSDQQELIEFCELETFKSDFPLCCSALNDIIEDKNTKCPSEIDQSDIGIFCKLDSFKLDYPRCC